MFNFMSQKLISLYLLQRTQLQFVHTTMENLSNKATDLLKRITDKLPEKEKAMNFIKDKVMENKQTVATIALCTRYFFVLCDMCVALKLSDNNLGKTILTNSCCL